MMSKYCKILDRIRTLQGLRNARKMHGQEFFHRKAFIISWLTVFRIRVQLPPAPPNDDPDTSGEVQKARMAQALRAFLCLSLSEYIRLNPVIIGIRLGIR